jgi:hypothetical protein
MWVLSVLVVVVMQVALLLTLLSRYCPVTHESYGRIEAGMKMKTVFAILGGPPGDYRTRIDHRPWPRLSTTEVPGAADVATWHGNEVVVVIWFGPGGEVIVSRKLASNAMKIGFLEEMRWRWEKLKAVFERWGLSI